MRARAGRTNGRRLGRLDPYGGAWWTDWVSRVTAGATQFSYHWTDELPTTSWRSARCEDGGGRRGARPDRAMGGLGMTRYVGDGDFRYEVVENWGRGPDGAGLGLVSSVAVDSGDRLFVYQRSPEPVMLIFDRDGTRLGSWGEGLFREPHGVWIGPDDAVYTTDSRDHTARRFTRDGTLLQTWGTPNVAGPPDMPFNRPTWAVVGPAGDLFVSDGYGQNRWHRLGADGALLGSWGTTGSGPGAFLLPHAIWVDRAGRVYVTDRTNDRVQIFSPTGDFLAEWSDLLSPNQVFIDKDDTVYIAEGGRRISVMSLDGAVLARWGEAGAEPGQFRDSPHSLWVDSRGDLYVSEVIGEDRLQKFARR